MQRKEIEVFVICDAASIAPGDARSFSLSRIEPDGSVRPFRIVVVRRTAYDYVGYINACPHQGVWLNIGAGTFLTADRKLLRCGRHGATFEIGSGLCVEGPCAGKSLEPVALVVVGGEVCLCGVDLVEDHRNPDPFDEYDDTMEIMIHPG